MKHLLNNISKEEKENILKQHSGGMKVMTENFYRLLGAKHGNAKPLVNEQEEENYDDDFFYKVRPSQSYYYDKNDNVSDIEDDTDMDVEEWDEDDFDAFYEKYPYKKGQRTFPDTEHGRRWFKGYSQEHGGKFPVFKRKKSVNEQEDEDYTEARREYRSDNSFSGPYREYLKNGDKNEVSELLSNLPKDTHFLALIDCEYADFSDIDLKDFKRLVFINLDSTPNNLLKTNSHSFEHDSGSFYVTKNL
jgi:hypothetical protein